MRQGGQVRTHSSGGPGVRAHGSGGPRVRAHSSGGPRVRAHGPRPCSPGACHLSSAAGGRLSANSAHECRSGTGCRTRCHPRGSSCPAPTPPRRPACPSSVGVSHFPLPRRPPRSPGPFAAGCFPGVPGAPCVAAFRRRPSPTLPRNVLRARPQGESSLRGGGTEPPVLCPGWPRTLSGRPPPTPTDPRNPCPRAHRPTPTGQECALPPAVAWGLGLCRVSAASRTVTNVPC